MDGDQIARMLSTYHTFIQICSSCRSSCCCCCCSSSRALPILLPFNKKEIKQSNLLQHLHYYYCYYCAYTTTTTATAAAVSTLLPLLLLLLVDFVHMSSITIFSEIYNFTRAFRNVDLIYQRQIAKKKKNK